MLQELVNNLHPNMRTFEGIVVHLLKDEVQVTTSSKNDPERNKMTIARTNGERFGRV